jgi:hypothetical protein
VPQHEAINKQNFALYLIQAGLFFGLFFDPKDEGGMFLRNVG